MSESAPQPINVDHAFNPEARLAQEQMDAYAASRPSQEEGGSIHSPEDGHYMNADSYFDAKREDHYQEGIEATSYEDMTMTELSRKLGDAELADDKTMADDVLDVLLERIDEHVEKAQSTHDKTPDAEEPDLHSAWLDRLTKFKDDYKQDVLDAYEQNQNMDDFDNGSHRDRADMILNGTAPGSEAKSDRERLEEALDEINKARQEEALANGEFENHFAIEEGESDLSPETPEELERKDRALDDEPIDDEPEDEPAVDDDDPVDQVPVVVEPDQSTPEKKKRGWKIAIVAGAVAVAGGIAAWLASKGNDQAAEMLPKRVGPALEKPDQFAEWTSQMWAALGRTIQRGHEIKQNVRGQVDQMFPNLGRGARHQVVQDVSADRLNRVLDHAARLAQNNRTM